MTYQEATEYLFKRTPLFQNIGARAYKEGLDNTYFLDNYFDQPHRKYRTIHIAGTNGKGTCAHTLAAILQSCGYKTGLYTSPHLVDFSERIRVNGIPVSKEYVSDFVTREKSLIEKIRPSFFEITTALAFKYFADQNIDVAVVEVGMGGRLDCTNIITPDLSVITNISLDHTQFLGKTLAKIAYEKAGIIKPGVPVVIGETVPETKPVFFEKAKATGSEIIFADEDDVITSFFHVDNYSIIKAKGFSEPIKFQLGGDYQRENANTILHAALKLRELGYSIKDSSIYRGFANVITLTGLRARWECIFHDPRIILDTGHNPAGLRYNMCQLSHMHASNIHIVIGMVSDKDVDSSLAFMPVSARYYFTQASVQRALDSESLFHMAQKYNLHGYCFSNVPDAFKEAVYNSCKDDIIYVGGSNFVIGDLLRFLEVHPINNFIY